MKKWILLAGASTALILSFMASARLKSRRASGFTEAEGYVGRVTDEGGVDLVDSESNFNQVGLTGQKH